MLLVDITEDGFVDDTCQGKLEVRVMSVAHIIEVLMRQCLQDSTWHGRQSGLGIVAVIKLTTVPASVLVL